MTGAAGERLRAAGQWLYGDRQGLVVWLALVCWLGLTWRVGIFIQDTYATANTLVALSDLQLHVTELRYSITFGSQPGLHEYNGRLYGRNYGQLALAVPLVWALDGAAALVDPRLLLTGLWAGAGLVLVTQVAEFERFDRQQTRAVGAAVVALLFLASVATATDLPRDQLALVAYQLSTLLAAATAGLVLYRLLTLLGDRRLGVAGGVALGVATPVGFWATIPKRHTLVAALVLATVYAFAVSRYREGRAALRARAGAYALAGFITWTHAFEALFVVLTLGVVDLATARATGPRQVAAVGFALLLASTPMLATNYAITGNPSEPPRLLDQAGTDVEFSPVPDPDGESGGDEPDGGGSSVSDGTEATPAATPQPVSDGGGEATGPPSPVRTIRSATATISRFTTQAVGSGLAVLTQPDRLWHVFVRSGTIPSVQYSHNGYETIELTLVEAMPLLGALAALPVLAVRRLWRGGRQSLAALNPRRLGPSRQTDLLVVALSAVLTIVYLDRVPLYSMLTVRYLHPVVALGLYGVCRLPAVREGVHETEWLGRSYLVGLVGGLAVLLGGIVTLDLAVGEAVQYNVWWNLGAAALCAGTVVGRILAPERVSARSVALGAGLPAGLTTAFLLLAGLVYFRYGRYAFDLVARLTDVLPAL